MVTFLALRYCCIASCVQHSGVTAVVPLTVARVKIRHSHEEQLPFLGEICSGFGRCHHYRLYCTKGFPADELTGVPCTLASLFISRICSLEILVRKLSGQVVLQQRQVRVGGSRAQGTNRRNTPGGTQRSCPPDPLRTCRPKRVCFARISSLSPRSFTKRWPADCF